VKTALIIIFLVISVILVRRNQRRWRRYLLEQEQRKIQRVCIEEGYSRSWCSVFCTGFGPVIKIHLDFTSCFDKKQLIFLGGVTLWEKKENA